MSFSDIINQEIAKRILKSTIRGNKIHHSYLFFGPEGSGKKNTALEFIKTLNCIDGQDEEPCDGCSSCRKTAKGIHPDIMFISPSGAKQVIGIDAVREVGHFVQLKSLEAKYKAVLIERPERFTKEAGNSFLKTLEEPPRNVVIILLTAFPEKILPTIVSRCQKVKFFALNPSEGIGMVKKKFNLDEKKAHVLYFVCSGKIKWIELCAGFNVWSLRDDIFEFLLNASSKEKPDYAAPLSLAESVMATVTEAADKVKKEKQDEIKEFEKNLSSTQLKNLNNLKKAEVEDFKREMIKIIFSIIKSFYADLFAINEGAEFIINKDKESLLKNKAQGLSRSYLLKTTEELERNGVFLDSGANLSLLFQVQFINLFCMKK